MLERKIEHGIKSFTVVGSYLLSPQSLKSEIEMVPTHSPENRERIARLEAFMEWEIYQVEHEHEAWHKSPDTMWQVWPHIETLKQRARDAGLWNLWFPTGHHEVADGLSNFDYAPLAEITGRVHWAPEVFNCSAPDTGNMEVILKYGTVNQQNKWLKPLMAGTIRSAFAMTEPQVASSDATNMQLRIDRDGDEYILNGRKWWTSNAMHPDCRVLIVMGVTDGNAPRHSQFSMVLVPMDTPGVEIVRSVTLFNMTNAPGGEAELCFENVRVPVENILLGEGCGFEIAQGRLGPGRIHHCMRVIGSAQRGLELMAVRADARVAFGKKLSEQGSVREAVARSYCEVEMARLLTLRAATMLDSEGARAAIDLIAAIKIIAPQMAVTVLDRAVQIFGGMGVSEDTPIANHFLYSRAMRIFDGPDEVHLAQLGRRKVAEYVALADKPVAARETVV